MIRRALRAVALAIAGMACGATGAGAQMPSYTDAAGLHVAGAKQLSARLSEVHVDTAALGRAVDIRILLPSGYAAHPHRRYPVLYLFHGTSGRASDWTVKGDAERITAGAPMIVVMPDAGFDNDGGGYFTNWYKHGPNGVPKWETFHIDQVIPWVDHNLRTIAARSGRAIYGLSQGGFGAMSYATRHADLFGAAGSFSGALDTSADPEGVVLMTAIVDATAFGLDGGKDADSMFGPRTTQEINWRAHDPAMLASNLRGMDLRLYTGNGQGGPFDGPFPNPGAVAIEAGAHDLTQLFHGHLQELHIPSVYRDYGPGTHSWPYWQRDLRDSVGPLIDHFDHPRPAPATIDYMSAENSFSAWGWDVAMHRPAREFESLKAAGRRGFTLDGSGSASVVTPPVYRPGARAAVGIDGERDAYDRTLTVDRGGRLHIEVPLGPGNPAQQYTAAALLSGTRVYSTTVRIRAPGRQRSSR